MVGLSTFLCLLNNLVKFVKVEVLKTRVLVLDCK